MHTGAGERRVKRAEWVYDVWTGGRRDANPRPAPSYRAGEKFSLVFPARELQRRWDGRHLRWARGVSGTGAESGR